MPDETRALILDLVEWIAARPRTYDAVMDAWRTSCPRLTIWEDAVDQRLVACQRGGGGTTLVKVTERGRALLTDAGRLPAAAKAS